MRLHLFFFLLLACIGVSGCQTTPFAGGQAPDASAVAQSPITGGAIAVTSLDAPKAAPVPRSAVAAPAAEPAVAPKAETGPQSVPPEAKATPPAVEVAEPVAPVILKTAAHLACEKRGGRWSVAGGGSAAFCQSPTKDAGKSCRKSTDCTGYCLEKSRTCAPVTPMLGCHDILNEAGRMLTQCIN
jgi:hypothetical protein